MGVSFSAHRAGRPAAAALWALHKGEHAGAIDLKAVPGIGAEIVLTVNGELRKARLFRSHEQANWSAQSPTRGRRLKRRGGSDGRPRGPRADARLPTHKIMLSLATYADELEREKARQRVTDAMQRKAKAGHVCGGRVFGYDNVEIVDARGKRSHVERRINEAEAAVVRRVFELCAEGAGLTRITKILDADGCPAPRPSRRAPVAGCIPPCEKCSTASCTAG